jgi:hypothetical protein
LIYAAALDGAKESIGNRIVEVPDNLEEFGLYDSRATFTAYAPVGSVAKGETLVVNGEGTRQFHVGCAMDPI